MANSTRWAKLQLRVSKNESYNKKEGISADNITANEVARRRDSKKDGSDAMREENAQSSASRLASGAPSWTVTKYRACYGRLFDARWFSQIFLDRKNTVRQDRRGVCNIMDIRARNRGWVTLFWWWAGSFESIGSFDMPIIRHEEKVEYLHRLLMLVRQAEQLVELDRAYNLSSCCMGRQYDHFYFIRHAAECWREFCFDCWQQTSVRRFRFESWHIPDVFELPQNGWDKYCARELDAWTHYKTARVLAVPTPVVCEYLSRLVMDSPVHERRLIRRITVVEFNVMSLSAFFWLVC